ncbi:hypothetical protein ACLOJK_004593 [Asimina triloba]
MAGSSHWWIMMDSSMVMTDGGDPAWPQFESATGELISYGRLLSIIDVLDDVAARSSCLEADVLVLDAGGCHGAARRMGSAALDRRPSICAGSRTKMGFSWDLGKMEDGGQVLFGSTVGCWIYHRICDGELGHVAGSVSCGWRSSMVQKGRAAGSGGDGSGPSAGARRRRWVGGRCSSQRRMALDGDEEATMGAASSGSEKKGQLAGVDGLPSAVGGMGRHRLDLACRR